jgi:hypothetical protein
MSGMDEANAQKPISQRATQPGGSSEPPGDESSDPQRVHDVVPRNARVICRPSLLPADEPARGGVFLRCPEAPTPMARMVRRQWLEPFRSDQVGRMMSASQ